ncbi:hypothetical protein BWI93_17000 [Siphonobacter sp. BAB-5385]|nr:hypothetical protein BWI93_17000 [Siphonobacter sp. BAB-5385]
MLTIAANTAFLQTFLTQRNLRIPKGTALYTYKTTQEEYESLRTLLATMVLTDQTAACFVLFAAEWWRRHYKGGFWEWLPIFEQIRRPEWNTPARRDDLMRKGCRYWNRPIFQHDTGPNSFTGLH